MGSAERIEAAARLTTEQHAKRPVAIVVSAMSKVTDLLLDSLSKAAAGDEAGDFDDDLQRLVDRMTELMHDAQGVGLAATQVGVLRRLFVFEPGEGGPRAVVNPRIVEAGAELETDGEGCLSLQGVRVPVERATTLTIAAISSGAGRSASSSGPKCCCISASPGAVQRGWSASRNRAISQLSCGRTWHSAVDCWPMRCLSAVQLGWPCSQAMASWASCRAGNSPAARRRFASSFRYRRLGRDGRGRVDVLGMAALPHARWSA